VDLGLGLKLGVRHGVYRASLPGRGEVRPLEQGLSGGETVFFGDACYTRRPRAFNGQLSVISKEAREYLPHVVLTLSVSRAIILWFFSPIFSECLLLSSFAKP
jgi:hypothetical protein